MITVLVISGISVIFAKNNLVNFQLIIPLNDMSVNKVILLGNVGRDPEIRYVEKRPIASFPLATDERPVRMPDGTERPGRTEWHNIIMWDGAAEMAERYIRKGTRMYIEGRLRYRIWEDRNTIKRTVTEIYVDSFELLGSPKSS